MTTSTAAAAGQYLTFQLAGQPYGLPIASVREINRMSDIAPVPHAAPFVAGVMNLRGKVIPVVDLRLKFGLAATPATKETCIIVIECDHGQIGMIVDAVSGVIELTAGQIEPPPVLGDADTLSFIIGMGKADDKVVVLVDTVAALSRETFAMTLAHQAAA